MSFPARGPVPRDLDQPQPHPAAEHADPQPLRGDRPLPARWRHRRKFRRWRALSGGAEDDARPHRRAVWRLRQMNGERSRSFGREPPPERRWWGPGQGRELVSLKRSPRPASVSFSIWELQPCEEDAVDEGDAEIAVIRRRRSGFRGVPRDRRRPAGVDRCEPPTSHRGGAGDSDRPADTRLPISVRVQRPDRRMMSSG